MKYDALTIDTNIITQNAYNLEHGILGQLSQFSGSPFQFVLSDIIVSETRRHVIARNQALIDKCQASLRHLVSSSLTTNQNVTTVQTIFQNLKSAEEAANDDLESFFARTGAEIIPVSGADMQELTNLYFGAKAPFEESGKKKNEFPDAIALLSLEAWADENDKRLLVISNDGGWHDYAKTSKRIDVESDLAKALGEFQRHTVASTLILNSFLEGVTAGEHEDIKALIEGQLADQIDGAEIELEASSYLSFDVQVEGIGVNDVSFAITNGIYDYHLVRIDGDDIVAKINVNLDVSASGLFSFYTVDSIDKDYVPLGDCSVPIDTKLDVSILVTINVDHEETPPFWEVETVELISVDSSLDFGDVVPFEEYEE